MDDRIRLSQSKKGIPYSIQTKIDITAKYRVNLILLHCRQCRREEVAMNRSIVANRMHVIAQN